MSNETPAIPAGWYPDASTPGSERYWDGTAWSHDQVRPLGTPTEPVAVLAPAPKKPWYKRPGGIIAATAGGVVLLFILIGALNSGSPNVEEAADKPSAIPGSIADGATEEPVEEEDKIQTVEMVAIEGMTVAEARAALEAVDLVLSVPAGAGDDWIVTTQTAREGSLAVPGASIVVLAEAPKPVYTVAQENAIEEALSYLNYSDFSRHGLTEQLTSEYGAGFEPADAEFAIATLEQTGQVDWNAEAAESAKSYMEYSSFSRDGLYEQLTSEYGAGFTPEQANYGLSQVGY